MLLLIVVVLVLFGDCVGDPRQIQGKYSTAVSYDDAILVQQLHSSEGLSIFFAIESNESNF